MSINKVGIVGSGIMAGGLIEVAARAGHSVVVRARKQAAAEAVAEGVAKNLDKQVAKQRLTADERDAIVARISVTDSLADLADCDLVIENVVEDLAVKKDLLGELGALCRPSTILATNTSTLPVVELAVASGRPDKVVGIHFFNPAPVMKLVEIVAPLTASDATVAAATAFAQGCGKDTVAVADRAGFVVNALLFPYLNNAIRMCENGTASIADIDTAMQGGCGFPMGPFALLDLVGLDTSLSILEALYAEFGDPNYAPVPTLRRKVAAGHLGRKSGQGFLTYGD
ncbi:MAG TPA: 3-hydroxybutyryl-CoA dehydrogenase [Ilumatobacter sp.]|nr:3-hydroxybutyryl-CoA dehydrogenase [Ilumatobacter sp.]